MVKPIARLIGVVLAITASVICTAQICRAQAPTDWPQWRGPLGTGVAPVGKPPVKWDATTNILWKVKMPGDGTSTPVIWGDKMFIQASRPAAGQDGEASTRRAKSDDQPKGGKGEVGKGKGPKGEFGGKGGFDKGGFDKGKFGKGPPPGGKGKLGPGSIPAPAEPYQFILVCLDKNTGKTLWEKVCREEVPHEGYRLGDGGYATASAMTDGEHVFAFFGSRGLYCFDLEGNLRWEKDLGDQVTRNGFGEGATPALFKNTIVVPWDHEGDDFIVALDKRTGSELWRRDREEPTTWATPLVVEQGGKGQVVMPGTNRLISYDLATGKTVWETEGLTLNAIPTAVTAEGIVYATAGYQGSKLLAIRLSDASGDITGTTAVLWRQDKDTPYVPSPLLSDNRLYFFKLNDALLTCLDVRTGKPHYAVSRIELGGRVYASPVAAGGHVYLVGRNGTTVVIKDADKLETVATNELGDPIDASPAVSGDRLYLRSRENVYCIGEK